MKIPSSEHFFFVFDLTFRTIYILCTQHVLSLEFSCTELVIQCTIFCHIVGYLVDTIISASGKDLPVFDLLVQKAS